MQIVTKVLDHLADETAPIATTAMGKIAKKLKDTNKNFVSFVEAPFKAEVVVYQTPEDFLE